MGVIRWRISWGLMMLAWGIGIFAYATIKPSSIYAVIAGVLIAVGANLSASAFPEEGGR